VTDAAQPAQPPRPGRIGDSFGDACHVEVVVDRYRLPTAVRVNGVELPRVVAVRREWRPGTIPTLVVTLEPTYFNELDEWDKPPNEER